MGLLSLIPFLEKIVDRAIPDPEERRKAQLELAKLADAEAAREHVENLGQIEVNKIEAGHRSLFVAGWRPFIGWVGGVGLATTYIIAPFASVLRDKPVTLDMGDLFILLGGLLGFGGLRTYEKNKGTANDRPILVKEKVVSVAPVEPSKKPRILPFDIPGIKGI